MDKIVIGAIITLMLLPTVSTAVQPQEKDIYLDTGGNVGRLIYIEDYFSKNESGNLTLDQSRTYFDGIINTSKIVFPIIRPLDKQGNRYSENRIRALATLNNSVILNTWYISDNATTAAKTSDIGTTRLIGLVTIAATLLIGIYLLKVTMRRMKKKHEKIGEPPHS